MAKSVYTGPARQGRLRGDDYGGRFNDNYDGR